MHTEDYYNTCCTSRGKCLLCNILAVSPGIAQVLAHFVESLPMG